MRRLGLALWLLSSISWGMLGLLTQQPKENGVFDGAPAGGQLDPMVLPTVTKKTETETHQYVIVTHSCPAGYEGHYVDPKIGFENDYTFSGDSFGSGLIIVSEEGPPEFTVCFEKSFMDKVRKNADMLSHQPSPPRPAE